ncbi:Uncharacterized phage protein gp47/JayE [Faunimonas pinastri]|uniref:Uncharacterized phage protein gp47/JayE n=1 Tax=Faunimonas pinastri TaxID=1855383 RepID=A0A1H9GDE9_9HYPH|nr:baseplate J/gp47 family protein [Faunimonas pinastri]SEQ48142.1 Uncharacterized phage protein gp47/JayE [Faunimonas pinastri]
MAYSTRSLATLSKLAWNSITSEIPGAIVNLWPNNLRVIGKVLALLDFQHELRRKWLWQQSFASTATDSAWLKRHGYEVGLTLTAATFATGNVAVSAAAGLVVPAGVQFTRADGAVFQTRTSTRADGISVTLAVIATAAGEDGNTDAETELTLVEGSGAPDGLGSTATVDASSLGNGSDEETMEAFRTRILDRKRQPPQGGSVTDFQRWVKEVSGDIIDVWVAGFTNDDRRVWVTFTRSDRTNAVPTASDVAAVQAYLDDDTVRPITARVYVTAPTPVSVPVTVSGLSPNNAAVQEAINAELAALFAERMEPAIPGTDFVLSRSWIDEAISRATGENRHKLSSPSDDITFSVPGQFPVLGKVNLG